MNDESGNPAMGLWGTGARPARLPPSALDLLFLEARSHRAWLPQPVPDTLLREIVDLAQLGPTSTNSQPMRIVFVRTPEGKTRLRPALHAGNVPKMMQAARAFGHDCGPMSGFQHDLVDAAFFGGTTLRSNFLCNLGHGNPAELRPRLPRFTCDEICAWA